MFMTISTSNNIGTTLIFDFTSSYLLPEIVVYYYLPYQVDIDQFENRKYTNQFLHQQISVVYE